MKRNGFLAGLLIGIATYSAPLRAAETTGGVRGTVVVDGQLPPPKTWTLEKDMQEVTGQKVLVDPKWSVGKNQGLANCVVTLRAKNPSERVPAKPLDAVVLEKIGAGFTPRVLVATPGTKLIYRNKNSPCYGFAVGGRHHSWYEMVLPGKGVEKRLDAPEICPVSCNVRPYMVAYLVIVDTPFFAVTDAAGHFTVSNLPPGTYNVTVWHEAAGKLTPQSGPVEITVAAKSAQTLNYQVKLKAP